MQKVIFLMEIAVVRDYPKGSQAYTTILLQFLLHFVCLSNGYKFTFIIIAKKIQLSSTEFILVLCKGTFYQTLFSVYISL